VSTHADLMIVKRRFLGEFDQHITWSGWRLDILCFGRIPQDRILEEQHQVLYLSLT